MKSRLLTILFAFTVLFLIPAVSLADDDAPVIDARLQGYPDGATVYLKDAGGTGLTWLLLIILGAICIGVLFMSSKRTHLD